MKKLLCIVLFFGLGAIGLGRFSYLASDANTAASRFELERCAVSNALVQLAAERDALREEIKSCRERIRHVPAADTADSESNWLAWGRSNRWSQAPLPELRRLLGLAWDASPDYVLVSKQSLKRLMLNGVETKGALTPLVCDVLAITPEERARIESLIHGSETEYLDWMKTNVQRLEPAGDIVAQYVVPANRGLSERLLAAGGIGMVSAIGLERTQLARNFALQWVQSHGLLGQASLSLTVRRSADGARLEAKCDSAMPGGRYSTGYAELSPGSFPELFRSVFPDGWRELAQKENFDLPAAFPSDQN